MTIKTAISLNETLFEKVEALAKELAISRSRLFSLAVEEYIKKHENQHLLRELNAAYADQPDLEEQTWHTHRQRLHRDLVEGEWSP